MNHNENEPQPMDKDELVTVYTVNSAPEAEILKNFLQVEGIKCEIGGENQAGFTGISEISIMVRAIDADQAEKLIRSREHPADD